MTYILYNPFSGNHSAEEEAKVVSALQNDETVVQDITAIKDYRSFFAQLTELVTGLFDFIKGGETVKILDLVSEILSYFKEFEAAGVIDIVKNFIGAL